MNIRHGVLLVLGGLAVNGVVACGDDDDLGDAGGGRGGVSAGTDGASGEDGGQAGASGEDGGQAGASGEDGGQAGASGEDGGQAGASGEDGGSGGASGEDGGSGGASGEDGGSGTDEDVQEYIDELPSWPDPGPEQEELTDLGNEPRTLDTDPGPGVSETEFVCHQVRHDISKNHDEILNLGGSEMLLKPGMLLQGGPFQHGILSSIPLPRSPVTLSIDLPAEVTSAVVESPTSATLQQAVADLQVQAGQVEGDLPALVSFTRTEVSSMEQLSFAVGAHGSYDNLVNSASFQAAFAHQQSERTTTVVATLLQPMYTISFADDEIARAADFFAPDVTAEDIREQEELGNIGPDNLPVFISSVTYGRMVIFTATSNVVESANQISAALEASFGKFQGGAEFDADTASLLSSLQIEVLALGGNSSAVTKAIVDGDYSQLFSNPDASSAVPLTYVVRNLAGTRPIARLGDVRQYVTEECTPVTASGWVQIPGPEGEDIEFSDVAANSDGEAFALGTYANVYEFDGYQFLLCQEQPDERVTDVAVDDDGWAYALASDNYIWKRNPDTGSWERGAGTVQAIDAVASGDIAGIGMNTKLYLEDRDAWDGWTAAFDDGEYDRLSLASPNEAWCRAAAVASYRTRRVRLDATQEPSRYRVEVSGLSESRAYLSAASEAEIWALTLSSGIVRVQWDASAESWGLEQEHGVPPPPENPVAIEATPNSRLWIITGSGDIYRYIP